MFHFFSLPSVFLHLDVSQILPGFLKKTQRKPASLVIPLRTLQRFFFFGPTQLLVMAFEASRPQFFFINKNHKWLPMIALVFKPMTYSFSLPQPVIQIQCCVIHKKQCLLHAAKKILPRSPKWSRLRLTFAHGLISNARLFRSLVPESMKREGVWWASPRIMKAFKRKPCQMSHKKTPRNFTRMKS